MVELKPQEVIQKQLELVNKLANEQKYRKCSIVSTDIAMYSVLSEMPDSLFVGELYESIFEQLDRLVSVHDINDKGRKLIKSEVVKYTMAISKYYKAKNKAKLYDLLRDFRYAVSRIQIKHSREIELKREYSGEQIITGFGGRP